MMLVVLRRGGFDCVASVYLLLDLCTGYCLVVLWLENKLVKFHIVVCYYCLIYILNHT